MDDPFTRAGISKSRLNWIYKISGVSGLLAGIILLIAMISLIITTLQPQTPQGGLSSLQNIWLIVIYKLHAGFPGVRIDQLQGLNLLDIVLLALVGTMHLGLYFDLRRTSKIWSIIALVQPFLGIVIFMATKTAGRSSVMGAGLVSSILMLRSQSFKRVTAVIGILASALLFAGDLIVGIPPNRFVVALFGIGYVLLIVWILLISRRLFQR